MAFLLKEHFQIQLNEEQLVEMQEVDKKGGPIIVKGVIQRADAKNQNGRIYPYDILLQEMDRYKTEFVDKGIALGECDHTEEPIIALKNVSHIIDDVWWDGPEKKDVWGKIRLLETPMGRIAKEIVLAGIPLGISSRAIGSVSKNEAKTADVVKDDLQLICFDLVGTPSTDNAFLSLSEARLINMDRFDRRKILPLEIRINNILRELLNKK